MHPEIDILLVEDNAGDVRLMTHMLAQSGIPHRLSVAHDGVEALDFLRRSGTHTIHPIRRSFRPFSRRAEPLRVRGARLATLHANPDVPDERA